MIAEAGNVDQFKETVLTEVYHHRYGCGHVLIFKLLDGEDDFEGSWYWCSRPKECHCRTPKDTYRHPVTVLLSKRTGKTYDY